MDKYDDVPPLQENGYRVFDIIGLAKAMRRSREYVETLIVQPGFPYFPLPGYKKPGYVEWAVCKYLRENIKYRHKV